MIVALIQIFEVGLNNAPHDRGSTNWLDGLRTVLGDGTETSSRVTTAGVMS
jgi:hypothetical protein